MVYITKDNLFMDELHKQELIEKFLEGKLTQKEQQQFLQLQKNDAHFQEEIDFFQRFTNVQRLFGKDELKLELRSLEKELQKEEALSFTHQLELSLQGMVKKLEYSLKELATLFQPQPEYQQVLAYGNRGNKIEITNPQNGIDASKEGLHFNIEGTFNKPLQLTIESNQRKILLSTSIDVFETHFSIKVDGLAPGRYYWKLKGEKETIIREFFIQKELML